MDNLIDIILSRRLDPGVKENLILHSLTQLNEKYAEMRPIYKLWWEYLKKSGSYRDICTVFRKYDPVYHLAFLGYPSNYLGFPTELSPFILNYIEPGWWEISGLANLANISGERYYKELSRPQDKNHLYTFETTIEPKEHPSFFWWAEQSEPEISNEMLMNFLIFGDVLTEVFETCWKRIMIILEALRKTEEFRVANLEEALKHDDYTMGVLDADDGDYEFSDGVEIAMAVKYNLEKNRHMQVILVQNPHKGTEQQIFKQVKALIKERRAELMPAGISKEQGDQKKQFEYPTQLGNMDKIENYLKVFNHRLDGLTRKDTYAEVYPNSTHTAPDAQKRVITRQKKIAEQIISNVEHGRFPGSYSS